MDFENIFAGFIDFVMGIISYIKELVGYFRATNDGKDAELPDLPLPDFGGETTTVVEE